jgi:nicotinamidase-related amidase
MAAKGPLKGAKPLRFSDRLIHSGPDTGPEASTMGSPLSNTGNSILVVIDYQKVFHPIVMRGKDVESLLVRALKGAGIFGVPVILSEHYPQGLGVTTEPVREAYDALETPRAFIEKTIFSCAGDPGFNAALTELAGPPDAGDEPPEVVLTGIESHVCVLQTALQLLERGYRVTALADTITSRGDWYTANGIEQMREAGVRISNSESVLFEWCRHKDHEGFRRMNKLLKRMPSPGTT